MQQDISTQALPLPLDRVIVPTVSALLLGFFMVFAVGFGAARSVLKLSCVLFVANSCGYFLGSALNDYAGGRRGMLLWGIIYGLFLGAGIGAVLQLLQTHGTAASRQVASSAEE